MAISPCNLIIICKIMKCGTLFAIFGRLGDGKTLALTYLCFDHWFKRKEEVYANYHLFKIPYHYVNSINKINIEGNRERTTFFALDEVWRLINARTPMANRNKIVYDILGRSRKRNITYAFTSQLKNAMDKNVVDVLDFISKPSLSPDEDMMRLDIFMGSKATAGTFMNAPRFITAPFMKLYESFEEVDMELEDNSEIPIIFQPYYNHKHGFCCECKECGTKFFKTYEEAERFAIAWWEKHWMEVFPPELLRDSQEVE